MKKGMQDAAAVYDPFREAGAECVWAAPEAQPNSYADFRHVFTMKGEAEDAVLYISADAEYAVWINGKRVEGSQYAGYPLHRAYDSIPVGAFLKEGKNVLCVRVFYEGRETMRYTPGRAYLIYALEYRAAQNTIGKGRIASGAETRCRITPSYLQDPDMEWITPQLGYTFCYDARREDHWTNLLYKEKEFVRGESLHKIDEGKGLLNAAAYCKSADGVKTACEEKLLWHSACILEGLAAETRFFPRPVKNLMTGEMVPARVLSQGEFSCADENEVPLGAKMQHASLSFREKEEFLSLPRKTSPYDHTMEKASFALTGMAPAFVVLEMKEPDVGFFSMTVTAGEGTVVEVAYGEHMEDLRVRSWVAPRSYAFSFICREGKQTITHPFRRVGGKYLQIFITPKGRVPRFHEIGILPQIYPLQYRGKIETGDRLFDRIVAVSDKTLRMCMHEHYEDCPFREQGLYTMDSHLQMLAGYYLYENDDFALASLRLSAEGAHENGLLRICSPSGWAFTIPSFSLLWIPSLRDHVRFAGWSEGAAALLPDALRILSSVAAWSDGTLLRTQKSGEYWNFYEWVDGLDDQDGVNQRRKHSPVYDAPLNALYCFAADAFEDLLRSGKRAIISVSDDPAAEKVFRVRDQIRQHFHETFYDGKSGLYRSYIGRFGPKGSHEYVYSMALLAGLIPPAKRSAARKLLADPASPLVKSTLSCCYFKYSALLMEQKKDRKDGTVRYPYKEYVFGDIAEKWGSMLFAGAQTFWETIGGAQEWEGGASLCHGWSGIPVYFLARFLLGIAPRMENGE